MKFLSTIDINKSNGIIIVCLTVIFIGLLAGCYNDKEELLYPGSTAPVECSTTAASFATDIKPLFMSKCAISGCHDATASGGVILQTYSQISAKKDRINVRALVEKTMPPTGALLPEEISKIKCWIDGGALDN